MNNSLEILLIEDDQAECNELIKAAENEPDEFSIIGVTNNSSRAIEYVADYRPDVVILDLELHHGGGDGLDFLNRLRKADWDFTPFILVTTNNISAVTHKAARELGADFIMTKNQDGYSAKSVLEFLKITKSVILGRKKRAISADDNPSPTVVEKRLKRRICTELNNVGINPKSVGYQYLLDAIIITINEPVQRICDVIGEMYRKTENSVERAMQNAINRAWKTEDIDVLLKNYTARIAPNRSAPTITEFIYFYAQKIKNDF